MNELIASVARMIVRLVLLAAAVVFAAALLVALVLLLAFWLLRAGWARLTGKPITPFVMRMNPRSGFDQVFGSSPARTQQPREIADVTDVEPKEPR